MKKIILLALLLIGCASKIPKWYLNPYNDTKYYIYATGEGKTKKEAINTALRNAISKIEITISSNFNIQKQLIKTDKNIFTYEKISQIIKTNIPNIRIYNYKIIKLKKENRFYVLISINRIKNANMIFHKAKEELQQIKTSISNDKIYILKNYPKLIKKTNTIISQLYFAYNIFPTKNTFQLLQKIILLKEKLQKTLKNIGFYVKNDYENLIKNTLSALNFPLKKDGILITQTHTQSFTKIMDYYISTINIEIILKDKSQINFNIICSGKSITNFKLANSFAIQECKNKLKEKLKNIFNYTQ